MLFGPSWYKKAKHLDQQNSVHIKVLNEINCERFRGKYVQPHTLDYQNKFSFYDYDPLISVLLLLDDNGGSVKILPTNQAPDL